MNQAGKKFIKEVMEEAFSAVDTIIARIPEDFATAEQMRQFKVEILGREIDKAILRRG